MESKITGGEWSVRVDADAMLIKSTLHQNKYLHSSRSIVSNNGQVVAQCCCNAPYTETMGEPDALTIEELDANANLLAAARDMQTAIRVTLACLGSPLVADMLRAALAKSEGREVR